MEGHILQVGEVVMGLTRFSKTREEAARRVTLPAAPGVGDLQPIFSRPPFLLNNATNGGLLTRILPAAVRRTSILTRSTARGSRRCSSTHFHPRPRLDTIATRCTIPRPFLSLPASLDRTEAPLASAIVFGHVVQWRNSFQSYGQFGALRFVLPSIAWSESCGIGARVDVRN